MTWTVHHINASPPSEIWKAVPTFPLMASTIVTLLVICILYPTINTLLLYTSKNYQGLDSDRRLVVVHHCIEALVLVAITPEFTYSILSVFFHEDSCCIVQHARILVVFSLAICGMYCTELASRYQKMNPLILFHHLVAILDGIAVCYSHSTIMVKAGMILVYMICFEGITFVGLIMYRLFPRSRATPKVIFAGMVCFGATRPIQLIWVFGLVIASWDNEDLVKWQAVLQTIVLLTVTVVQVLSLKIHHALWKRCLEHQFHKVNSDLLKDRSDDESESESESETETETETETEPVSLSDTFMILNIVNHLIHLQVAD